MLGQKIPGQSPTQQPPRVQPPGPPTPPGGRFAGLKDAVVTTRGNYLRPGCKYTVRVKKAVYRMVREPAPPHWAFILEFDIVSAVGEGANQVGTSASWFVSLADPTMGFSNLKGFAAGITGMNDKDPQFIEEVEPFLDAVVDGNRDQNGQQLDDGAINGWLLPVETILTKTKKGGDFTIYRWSERIAEG